MPFKCLRASAYDTGALIERLLLGLLCCAPVAGGSAAEETATCALTAPKYQIQGDKISFDITLDCAAAGASQPIPLGTNLLVGLTVYDASDANAKEKEGEEPLNQGYRWSGRTLLAGPDVAAALGKGTQSTAVQVAGRPKWIVLTDADHDSFDFPAQTIRIERKDERLTVTFQADEKDLAEKDHLLFALWPASARKPCDKEDEYSRSGCRNHGYVIQSDAGVDPLAAYPGLEINEFDDATAERWIVERFR